MFSSTSKSRRSITILSASAAALLITGLGVSNASATNLTWDPSGSSAGASNGSGTWNSSGTYWYNGTGAQAWASGDGAYFGSGTGGSGTYTVTLGSSGTYSTPDMGINNSGNAYVLDGSNGTVSGTGQVVVNGNLTLENIKLSGYGTIAVNTGGVIGSVLNINTGSTLTMASASNLYLSDVPNNGATGTTGTVNVNGGSITVQAVTVDASNTKQTGILNINSGTVTTTAGAAGVTSKSGTNIGSPTIVNLNGGTLNTNWITATNNGNMEVNFNGGTLQSHAGGGIGEASSAYTLPTNLNVQAGGAVIDTNAHTYWIQSPLLHDATLGSTPDGGLTVLDSKSTASQTTSTVTLQGANTYTGATTVQGGGNLILAGATTDASGAALAAATIADSSAVNINSNGVLTLANDVTSANTAPTAATQVQALNMTGGGSISFLLNATQSPTLSISSKASVSGINNINVFAVSGTTSFTMGTYTLITDSLGGLSGGTFQFTGGGQTAIAGPLGGAGGPSYLLTLGTISDTAETLTIGAVPEPATLGLLAMGGMALVLLGRKRKIMM